MTERTLPRPDVGGLATVELEVDEAVDRTVFSSATPFDAPFEDQGALRTELILAAVRRHCEHSPGYARFAERSGFRLDRVKTADDLHQVPQIPTTLFKRAEVVSGTPAVDWKRCTSSGTAGTLSIVWRDRTTLERLCGSLRRGLDLIGTFRDDDTVVLNLGPDVDRAGDLWYAYVMSLAELLLPAEHCLVGEVFEPPLALSRLHALLNEVPHIGVVGPPALVAQFARHVLGERVALPYDRVTVVTGGGWKRAPGALSPRDFRMLTSEAFRIDATAVRDTFNQVELNTVIVECKSHRLHVPPWLHIVIRDPRTLLPVPYGQTGLASYLDPTAVSYPCFIIADDIAKYDEGVCECGMRARWLELVRRIRRPEQRGCAAVIDRRLAMAGG